MRLHFISFLAKVCVELSRHFAHSQERLIKAQTLLDMPSIRSDVYLVDKGFCGIFIDLFAIA